METAKTITIHAEYTSADIIHACRVYQATTLLHKVSKILAVVSFALGCWAAYTREPHWFTIALFVFALIEWFDPVKPLQAWIAFKMNPKLYTQSYEVTFDEEGVHAKTGTTDARRSWAAYSTVLESDRLFLLVHGRLLYAAIPKRAFSGEEEVAAFRQMVERKVDKFG